MAPSSGSSQYVYPTPNTGPQAAQPRTGTNHPHIATSNSAMHPPTPPGLPESSHMSTRNVTTSVRQATNAHWTSNLATTSGSGGYLSKAIPNTISSTTSLTAPRDSSTLPHTSATDIPVSPATRSIHQLVMWAGSASPNSTVPISNTNFVILKDNDGLLKVVLQNKPGVVDQRLTEELHSRIRLGISTLYQDSAGNFQYFSTPPTGELAQRYHPYSPVGIPRLPSESAQPAIQPPPRNQPQAPATPQSAKANNSTSAAHGGANNSPASATRPGLARDILRALIPRTSEKRRRESTDSVGEREGSKRQLVEKLSTTEEYSVEDLTGAATSIDLNSDAGLENQSAPKQTSISRRLSSPRKDPAQAPTAQSSSQLALFTTSEPLPTESLPIVSEPGSSPINSPVKNSVPRRTENSPEVEVIELGSSPAPSEHLSQVGNLKLQEYRDQSRNMPASTPSTPGTSKLPLFLPSPPGSPAVFDLDSVAAPSPDEPAPGDDNAPEDGMSWERARLKGEGTLDVIELSARPKRKVRRNANKPFVLIPPAPRWVKQYQRAQSGKPRRPWVPENSSRESGSDEEDFGGYSSAGP
jgi:hypothetical protein